MIYFLDTSALVKRYIEEPGSDNVQTCFDSAKVIAVSRLAYPETLSAIVRRKPSLRDCTDDDFHQLVENFRRDWNHFMVLGMNHETLHHVERVIETYRLRGADSIHLSAALWLHTVTKSPVVFVTSDNELLSAASAERLMIFNPAA